jgi:hypothetical protein
MFQVKVDLSAYALFRRNCKMLGVECPMLFDHTPMFSDFRESVMDNLRMVKVRQDFAVAYVPVSMVEKIEGVNSDYTPDSGWLCILLDKSNKLIRCFTAETWDDMFIKANSGYNTLGRESEKANFYWSEIIDYNGMMALRHIRRDHTVIPLSMNKEI